MKITYTNDTAKGAGYGIFTVTDCEIPSNPDTLEFSLRRASDQHCLGKEGWQPAELFFRPLLVTVLEGSFALHLGPEVIDNLDPQETYRLTLQGAGFTTTRTTLTVAGILFSDTSKPSPIEAKDTEVPPVHIEPAAPEPAPEPSLEKLDLNTTEKGLKLPEEPMLTISAPSTRTSPLPKILGALIVLLLIGGGVYYFINKETQTPSVVEAEKPEQPSLREQAHKLLADKIPHEAAFTKAKEFRSQPEGADPAFLLAEDAAEKGNAEAMIMTADFYDPTSKEASGSIQKSALSAYQWYKKAAAAGNAQATDKITELRTWAETTKDNKEAEELVLELKKASQ